MTDSIKALPIESAPKNNTFVRLLVDYSGEGDHPLEDAVQAWTIGFNNFEDSEIDEWQFAGWSWSQDCFCEGQGRVIGWAPFHPETRLYDAAAPMADGGETPMTAAEEVLAWLLVEKIGVPDDVSYTPDQAQKIIADRLAQTQPPVSNVRGWTPADLEVGKSYEAPNWGWVKYKGTDCYGGDLTYAFEVNRPGYGMETQYVKEARLNEFLAPRVTFKPRPNMKGVAGYITRQDLTDHKGSVTLYDIETEDDDVPVVAPWGFVDQTLSRDQKELVLLRIIAAMGGETDSSEGPRQWLNWFCDDENEQGIEDTFNRCNEKGWLRTTHNSDFETSTTTLTLEGRDALAATETSRHG